MKNKFTEYAEHLEADKFVIKWTETTLDKYLAKNSIETEEVEHIIDFFISEKPKVSRMSYLEAKTLAEKWNKSLQKKGGKIDEEKKDTEVVLDFKDGFKFVKLIGKNAYEREGFLMSHCFQGDTQIVTFDGSFPIKELSGKKVSVLTRSGGAKIGTGSWVESNIKHFGKQQLWGVTIEKNQGSHQEKTIYTTNKHRWFVFNDTKNKQKLRIFEKTTDELTMGEKLPHINAKRIVFKSESKSKGINLSSIGVMHGIVFGDGTTSKNRSANVTLYGKKDKQLLNWFPKTTSRREITRSVGGIQLFDLPKYFKKLPSLEEETATYLIGWLAGYFAADGNIDKKGCAKLTSANKENLIFAERVCRRFGIITRGIQTQSRKGYGKENSNLYKLIFEVGTLPNDFFLIKEHRERNKLRSQLAELWSIKRVFKTNEKDDVYCAIVPKTQCFAIEDNILTGNCVTSYFGKPVEIFSLRDKDNMPHCTVEKDQQIKGKGNGDIHPKYIDYVVRFLEHTGMAVRDSEMAHLGYETVEFGKYSKTKLYRDKYAPKGTKIEYQDDLKIFEDFNELKNYLGKGVVCFRGNIVIEKKEKIELKTLSEVSGYVYVYQNATFTAPNLKVSGYVDVYQNATFTAPKLEQVSGYVDVYQNATFTAPNLKVGGYVDVYQNATFTAPKLEQVSGYVDVRENATFTAPKLEQVGGYVYVRENATFTAPKLEQVSGSVYVQENATFTAPNLKVSGYVDVQENATFTAPKLEQVSGSVYVQENATFTAPNLKVSGSVYVRENGKLIAPLLKRK